MDELAEFSLRLNKAEGLARIIGLGDDGGADDTFDFVGISVTQVKLSAVVTTVHWAHSTTNFPGIFHDPHQSLLTRH